MDENVKKEKLAKLKEDLRMLKEISKPLLTKIDETERQIRLYERVKKVGDKIRWEKLWDQREEDSYEGEIVEVNLEKQIYKVKITDFFSSYGGRSSAHTIIGHIKEIEI